MTTRLPTTMIAPNSPLSVVARDGSGAATIFNIPSNNKVYGYGCECTYVDDNAILITAGKQYSLTEHVGELTTDVTKTFDSFTSGDNQGGLDAGLKTANTFYYPHLIKNTLTNAADVLISASATAPTIPADHVHIKRLGAIWVDANSNIRPFVQIGKYFGYQQAILEGSVTNPGNINVNHKIPNQLRTNARIYIDLSNSGNYRAAILYRVQGANQTLGPTPTYTMWAAVGGNTSNSNSHNGSGYVIFTTMSGSINYLFSLGYGGTTTTRYLTQGWYDLDL